MTKELSESQIALNKKIIKVLMKVNNPTSNEVTAEIRKLYMHDSNPLFVWLAYDICRKNDMPLPEWVLEYLDASAGNLLSKANDKVIPVENNAAKAIAKALDMNTMGPGNVFKRYKRSGMVAYATGLFARYKSENKNEIDENIAAMVIEKLEEENYSIAKPRRNAKDFDELEGELPSIATIIDWYRKYK